MAGEAATLRVALVLDVDPDLGTDIDPAEWEVARRACRGELLSVPRGPWQASDATGRDDLVAYVIVDGLLARELSFRDHSMVELLGHGDALQPPAVSEPPRLGTQTQLTAVSDLLVLALGQPFIRVAARWPALLVVLQRRLERQRESLAIQGLISHRPNAEHRLLLLLWHLSERWGYVTSEGVVLPWPLSHEILGRLIGARRPTVTIALRRLQTASAVRRREDGSWLLTEHAERMVTAVVGTQRVGHSVGERLMLYREFSRNTTHARAVQAEAKQIRLRPPARPTARQSERFPAQRMDGGTNRSGE